MKTPCVISYQLILKIENPIRLTIGALGPCEFPAGIYIYTGSARRNMEKRIARHFSKKKPLRWHIDYLTSHPQVNILAVNRYNQDECLLNQQTKGEIMIIGFGASDCKAKCGAHLKKIS